MHGACRPSSLRHPLKGLSKEWNPGGEKTAFMSPSAGRDHCTGINLAGERGKVIPLIIFLHLKWIPVGAQELQGYSTQADFS